LRTRSVVAVALATALVGGTAGVGYAAYRHDATLRGLLPPGAVVGGIDVSRLDRAAAVAAVRAVVERDFDRPATVTVGGRAYTVTARALGVRHDVEAAVDAAFREAAAGNWASRAWARVVDDRDGPARDVTVTGYDPARLEAVAARAAKELDVPAVDAGVREVGGWLRFVHATPGRAVDRAAVVAALRASLADGKPREVGLREVAPRAATPDTAILVRTGENKLYLYQHGRLARTYGVATGSPRYSTPTGRFEVTLKRYRPTWVNPWSPWSMNEPARIGPGPNNPLGTRALNLSAPGIRIHGTPAAKSIGYSVSHGCIRMRMPDVEALYELVPKGTPVFIVKAGPPRLPGSRAVDAGPVADGG
jgi:lipoprotein-anchoring transpeptidase ErfK/SrfK